MDFFASFRVRRLASVAIAAAGIFFAASTPCQVAQSAIPDAPVANSTTLHATLSDRPALYSANMNSSSPAQPLPAGDVSLYTVVDLALRNSKAVQVAEAEQQRTLGFSKEMRDAYIPSFSAGSGLGYSYGFPLGTPTIFNVTSTSLLFSFSQHDYIRSARAAWKAATLSLQDTRQQVIFDASIRYIDLEKTISQIAALHEAATDTNKLLAVMSDRMNAGLETNIQMTQARLTEAQINLRAIQMEDHADELRQHIGNLTGLSAELIVPAASSIPPMPDLNFPSLLRAAKPPAIQAADATADAKMYAAWGDKRQNYRPTVQFASQYALFSTFNNYTEYYNAKNFQYNNYGIGIQAVWPLFDPIRKDKAMQSQAEAVHARRQAEMDRIQNDEGNLALWHSLRELEAQEQVASLQQQLAQDMLAATVTQMNGSVGANGAPVTPLQAEQQRIDERNSYVDLEDAQFNVTKVELNLLNAVGGLEDWAKQGGQAASENNARK